jgi:WD repeat-containing protein 35
MAVNAAIYFANIKIEHKWGFMDNGTFVVGYQKSDRIEYSLIFWDSKTEEKTIKFVKNLCEIRAAGDLCCIITRFENNEGVFFFLYY